MASNAGSFCSCGTQIQNHFNFCPSCGEIIDNHNEIIKYYFSRGYKYKSIISLLSKQHGIHISERTLKYRLKALGLRRKSSQYDLSEIRLRITQELNGPSCMGGYRSIWHTLRMEGHQVPRHIVEELMRDLDPVGCSIRKAKRLRRRTYINPGPNFCWHLDGYDKLKPYGFPIHGCIDGWSRKIIWLRIARSNNKPEVPATFFLESVERFGGCPVKVRTDCGTENGIIAAMQCEFRKSAHAHIYGSSPSNQRIEGWWSFYRRNRSTWWINYFSDLIETELFHPGNELEQEALWFCFSDLLQRDLNLIMEHWNTHYIRKSTHNTVCGRPDELFLLPEQHGGTDELIQEVDSGTIQYVVDNLLYFNEDENNDYQDYFKYITSHGNLDLPKCWEDAEELYIKLVMVALS